jgi:predicted HTH transcriptional regulator
LTGGVLGIGWLIDLFTLGGQVDTYNILHGSMGGGGNQSQNVVVNVAVPAMAPPVATDQAAVPQITQASPLKISAEKAILALADKTPVMTLRQIMVNANLEMEEAENAVKKLVAKGMAKEEVDPSGKSTYTFD